MSGSLMIYHDNLGLEKQNIVNIYDLNTNK